MQYGTGTCLFNDNAKYSACHYNFFFISPSDLIARKLSKPLTLSQEIVTFFPLRQQ